MIKKNNKQTNKQKDLLILGLVAIGIEVSLVVVAGEDVTSYGAVPTVGFTKF